MTKGRLPARTEDTGASTLPEIGKLKIGVKKTNGSKEYPAAIDYFRATGNFANVFAQKFGEKPKELKVAFVSNNLTEVCNQRLECWEGGKRWGWSDGETYTIWDKSLNGGKGGYRDLKADTDANKQAIRAVGKWDEMLTLRFVLLEMPGIYGYWTFQTKAKAVTIPSITKAFDMVMERAGTIVGFPFSLMVEMKKGFNPGDARQYPVVTLVPNFTQDTIEMVQTYIQAGGDMNRLTTRMIETNQFNIETLQIGQGQPTEEGQ